MKIGIPVKEDEGLESVPYNHFGTAPMFIIYNSENEQIKVISNNDLHHQHGMCQPLRALAGEQVDAILVGGIGAGALVKLQSQGIKVYRTEKGTVSANIDLLKRNELVEFSSKQSCDHHDCEH